MVVVELHVPSHYHGIDSQQHVSALMTIVSTEFCSDVITTAVSKERTFQHAIDYNAL